MSRDAVGRDGALLAALASRRSAVPRRLHAPGPSSDERDAVLRVALRAPDHGGLVPWRVVEFPPETRSALAEGFVAEKLRRQPATDSGALMRTKRQALDPPLLLAFVARVDPLAAGIPAHEQWLAAGAALGNLLNGFHALGYGAGVLSGERCADPGLAREIGIGAEERLVGWISVGSVESPPRPAAEKPIDRVWSRWTPRPAASGPAASGPIASGPAASGPAD